MKFYAALVIGFASLILSACMASPSAKEGAIQFEGSGSSAIPVNSTATFVAGDIAHSRYGVRALMYLEKNRDRYGIVDARNELAFLREDIDTLGQKHVRFQQVQSGVPVWGHQLIVHFDQRDQAMRVTGSFLPGLGRIDVRPRISAEEAAVTAVSVKGTGWRATDNTLYIYSLASRPHLAWHVTLKRGLDRWFIFVNANDGAVLHQITGAPTAEQ